MWHPWSNDIYFELLLKLQQIFIKGGIKRMKYTIPSLVFALIRLSQTIQWREVTPVQPEALPEGEPEPQIQVSFKRLFNMIRECLAKLQGDYPELALRLNLQSVQAINNLTG